NRTYRYFNGKPLFAFGHGLSYSRFTYADTKVAAPALKPDESIKVSFAVKNAGERDGEEVAQVYFRHIDSAAPQPKLALCGFARAKIAKGETSTVTIDIPAQRLRYWDTNQKQYVVEPGKYELLIGGASDDIRARVPVTIER